MNALLDLKFRNIVFLPIHDAFFVDVEHEDQVKDA